GAGPARAPAAPGPARGALRGRSAAVGAHPRRSDLAVALHRAGAARRPARRALRARQHAALRDPRLPLLGPAGAAARPARDHAGDPARWLRCTALAPRHRPIAAGRSTTRTMRSFAIGLLALSSLASAAAAAPPKLTLDQVIAKALA